MKKLSIVLLLIFMMISANTVFAQAVEERSNNIFNTIGIIDSIDKDSIAISGEGTYKNLILRVTDESYILNGKTGENLDFSTLKEHSSVSVYYDGRMTRSIPPIGFAKAIVVGDNDENGLYMQVREVEKIQDGVRVLCSNGDRLVTIKNDILADAKNISAGDELLVWYKAMTLSLPGQAVAEKAVILNKKPDITVGLLDNSIIIKGNNQVISTRAIVKNEKILLPLRQIAEKFGYTVSWKEDSKSAELLKGPQFATLTIDSHDYGKNKMRIVLDDAPQMINGVTYVPSEFFEKALELSVKVK
ncbi:stalk domain-containing protein [Anaerosinus sp.]|uniref:stalk domain-containing protein n=1 Tax=Selenobaculum sp. TaxID=3074374 RepID=UPI0015AEE9B9